MSLSPSGRASKVNRGDVGPPPHIRASPFSAGSRSKYMLGSAGTNFSRKSPEVRWAWQAIPFLALPPVQAAETGVPVHDNSKHRPTSLATRVENRVVKLKETDGGVANALIKADQILGERRRELVGRWASARNFIRENRCLSTAPRCCRRRRELESFQTASSLRAERRDMAVVTRDAIQRRLIADTAIANHEIKASKNVRDRVFAELVYKRIFDRTGGNARFWMVVVASVRRLLLLKHVADTEAHRGAEELDKKRKAIVYRFLLWAAQHRRRTAAANILAGALSALTNSNAIVRYANRLRWASRRLQRLSRQRAECTIAHVYALVRHWDRMFPTRPPSPPLPSLSPSLERSTSPRPSKSDPISPNHPTSTAVQTATASTAKKNSKQQPVPRRGARGGGAASKTSKRRGRAKASRARKTKKGAGTNEAKSCESYDEDEKKRRVYVSDEAKEEEIVCWLRRTREIHVRELSAYERHTIYPHMVELLLQHKSSRYRTRLQALKHVNILKVRSRLTEVWMREGFYKKVAHVIPPPPRLRRFFTEEEGKVMYKRALARSATRVTAAATSSTGGGGMGDGDGERASDDIRK